MRSPASLALHGGTPVRSSLLPYGRQKIDEDDLRAVQEVLQSDWLTTGPTVDAFEAAVAELVGAAHGVAVTNGTAALHCAMHALGIGPGDEVIVPTMTFAASANCAVFQGATPVFADVDPETLLLDPEQVRRLLTPRTRAVVAVDYAGQPCDYDALRAVTEPAGIPIVADGCHALGGSYQGVPVGSAADLTVFSFHPVKHLTTGEGGMITTANAEWARRMRVFRNHGITTDHRQRSEKGSWFYEMVDLGYNYRLTDIQCALGLSQLRKQRDWVRRRQEIAAHYDRELAEIPAVSPLTRRPGVSHAYHLYVVLLESERLAVPRGEVFAALRAEGIGVNVHYVPVHLHPFYRDRFGTRPGLCPVAEAAYERMLSLPMFPTMSDRDVEDVLAAVRKVSDAYTSF
ncbi:MAG: UDP-4-amino-4,6-dideoxy-N-acetyl-beta-L-altrosamine transaminase [Armatimonadota bacterium]